MSPEVFAVLTLPIYASFAVFLLQKLTVCLLKHGGNDPVIDNIIRQLEEK